MPDQGPFTHWQSALDAPSLAVDPTPTVTDGDLPPVFQFSQNSLQDYVDCARRFQLRYVIGQRWPAAESEPIEEHEHFVNQGSEFHALVQRHLLGIDATRLTPDDDLLRRWWDAYLNHPPVNLPESLREPEIQLSTPIGDHRLLARFDLLTLDPGERAVIVDWKTTRHRPNRQTLAERLQTRVYPYVLVEAGPHLFGGLIDPAQVSLLYWFAEDPARPEIFRYDDQDHERNRVFLRELIAEILAYDTETWPLTDDERRCQYCVYRSLCDRGTRAGPVDGEWQTDSDEPEFDFDLDDIDEIAF